MEEKKYCFTTKTMIPSFSEEDDITTDSFNFERGLRVLEERERKEYAEARREKIAQFNEHRRVSTRYRLRQFFNVVRNRIKF